MNCSNQLSTQYTQQNTGTDISISLNDPIPAVIEVDTSFLQSMGVTLISVESKTDDRSQTLMAVPDQWKIVYVPQLTDSDFWNGFSPGDSINYWMAYSDGTKKTGTINLTKTSGSIALASFQLELAEPLPASAQFSLSDYTVLDGFKITSISNLSRDICQAAQIATDGLSFTYYPDMLSGYWFSQDAGDTLTLSVADTFTGETNNIDVVIYRNPPKTGFQAVEINVSREMYFHQNDFVSFSNNATAEIIISAAQFNPGFDTEVIHVSKPANKSAGFNTHFTSNSIYYTPNISSGFWKDLTETTIDKVFYTLRNKYTGQISSAAVNITMNRSSQYFFAENIAMVLDPYTANTFSPLLNVNEYYFDRAVTLTEVDKIDFSSIINAVNFSGVFYSVLGRPSTFWQQLGGYDTGIKYGDKPFNFYSLFNVLIDDDVTFLNKYKVKNNLTAEVQEGNIGIAVKNSRFQYNVVGQMPLKITLDEEYFTEFNFLRTQFSTNTGYTPAAGLKYYGEGLYAEIFVEDLNFNARPNIGASALIDIDPAGILPENEFSFDPSFFKSVTSDGTTIAIIPNLTSGNWNRAANTASAITVYFRFRNHDALAKLSLTIKQVTGGVLPGSGSSGAPNGEIIFLEKALVGTDSAEVAPSPTGQKTSKSETSNPVSPTTPVSTPGGVTTPALVLTFSWNNLNDETELFLQISTDGNNWVTFNTIVVRNFGRMPEQKVDIASNPVLHALQEMNVFIRLVSDLSHISNVLQVSSL